MLRISVMIGSTGALAAPARISRLPGTVATKASSSGARSATGSIKVRRA